MPVYQVLIRNKYAATARMQKKKKENEKKRDDKDNEAIRTPCFCLETR